MAGKLDGDEDIAFTSDDVENLKEDAKATQCSLIGSPEGIDSREIATITGNCSLSSACTFRGIPYFFGYKTEFFSSKTISKI